MAHIPQTVLLRFQARWVDQRAIAYPWGNYLARIYRQNYGEPSHVKLDEQLFSHIFTSMFVMLAKKKVKRQCSSKSFVKSKATAELSKQDRK